MTNKSMELGAIYRHMNVSMHLTVLKGVHIFIIKTNRNVGHNVQSKATSGRVVNDFTILPAYQFACR